MSPRPVDRKSNALPVEPPRHLYNENASQYFSYLLQTLPWTFSFRRIKITVTVSLTHDYEKIANISLVSLERRGHVRLR